MTEPLTVSVPCDCDRRVQVHAGFIQAIGMTSAEASLHYTEWELAHFVVTMCVKCEQEWYIIPTGEKHRCVYCTYLEGIGIEIPQFGTRDD